MLHYNFLYVTVHLNVLFVFPVSSFPPFFFHVLHLWIKDALTPPSPPPPTHLPFFYSLPLYHFHFVVSLWPGVLCICLMHHWLSVCFVFVRAAGMSCCMRVSWLIDSSIPVSCFISQGGRCCGRKKLLWQGSGGHSPSSCLLLNGWHWLWENKGMLSEGVRYYWWITNEHPQLLMDTAVRGSLPHFKISSLCEPWY